MAGSQRYTPNAVPADEDVGNFLGRELDRLANAFKNAQVDSLEIVGPGLLLQNNKYINWRSFAGVPSVTMLGLDAGNQLLLRNEAGTTITVEQVTGNNGKVELWAQDGAATRRALSWQPGGGTSGGLLSLFGRNAIEAGDVNFLWLNRAGDFTSGIQSPGALRLGGIMRADGGVDLGNAVGRLRLGATRGSINTIDAIGGWYGYQMNARVALLHDGANAFEIRDLVNSKSLFAATLAAEASLYFNNVQTFKTQASNAMLHDGTVFRKMIYDTGQVTISAAVTGNVTHSLGYTPGVVHYFLECTTADNGYAIGDRVAIPITISTTTAAGIQGWCNATQVGYTRSAAIHFGNKTTGAAAALTLTSWRFRAIVTL